MMVTAMSQEKDDLDYILDDFELAEFIFCIVNFLDAMLRGCPVRMDDARIFLNASSSIVHPVMAIVRALRE